NVDGIRQVHNRMVLEIGADGRIVHDDIDAMHSQVRGRPDTRQHEKLRRPDSPSAHYHLCPTSGQTTLSLLHILHADSSAGPCGYSQDGGVALDDEICAPTRWREERSRCAVAPTTPHILLDIRDALLAFAVVVIVHLVTAFYGPGDERVSRNV